MVNNCSPSPAGFVSGQLPSNTLTHANAKCCRLMSHKQPRLNHPHPHTPRVNAVTNVAQHRKSCSSTPIPHTSCTTRCCKPRTDKHTRTEGQAPQMTPFPAAADIRKCHPHPLQKDDGKCWLHLLCPAAARFRRNMQQQLQASTAATHQLPRAAKLSRHNHSSINASSAAGTSQTNSSRHLFNGFLCAVEHYEADHQAPHSCCCCCC